MDLCFTRPPGVQLCNALQCNAMQCIAIAVAIALAIAIAIVIDICIAISSSLPVDLVAEDLMAKYFGGSSERDIGIAFTWIDADGSKDLSWEDCIANLTQRFVLNLQ